MKRSTKIIIGISIAVYSFIIGLTGLFGETVQNALFFFIKNILPYIGIAIGYFLVVFIPIRVIQALENNKRINDEYNKDMAMVKRAEHEKAIQENILSVLHEEDEL